MTDYERGYYYGIYKKRVYDDEMLSQKILGILISAIGIILQIMVGMVEFAIASLWIVAMGLFLIMTKENFLKGD